MPQSLSAIYVHLIYSTKNREPLILPEIEEELRKYITGILNNLGCPLMASDGTLDHLHILFRLGRQNSIAEVVEELKKSSSKWIKTKWPALKKFYWQNGYAAFSVSQSGVEAVKAYIANQKEHHKRISFQDEFREFLRKHDIEFDERYVWD